MLDATEIFRTLPAHKKETFFKLGFYLLSFFFYLYKCVFIVLPQNSLLTTLFQDDHDTHRRKRVIPPTLDCL